MILSAALHGQRFNTPISCSDLVNRVHIGLNILVEREQEIQVIRKNLKEGLDR